MKVGDTVTAEFEYNKTTHFNREVRIIFEDELGCLFGVTQLFFAIVLVQIWQKGHSDKVFGSIILEIDTIRECLKAFDKNQNNEQK